MSIKASKYHDFSTGHRVYGHESKCAHLHGHNYRVHFYVEGSSTPLDNVGRVLDFSVISERLADWVERNWDHKFLVWEDDPFKQALVTIDPDGVIITPFNPTAENMGLFLLEQVGPTQLMGTDTTLVRVVIEETRKCSVEIDR